MVGLHVQCFSCQRGMLNISNLAMHEQRTPHELILKSRGMATTQSTVLEIPELLFQGSYKPNSGGSTQPTLYPPAEATVIDHQHSGRLQGRPQGRL